MTQGDEELKVSGQKEAPEALRFSLNAPFGQDGLQGLHGSGLQALIQATLVCQEATVDLHPIQALDARE